MTATLPIIDFGVWRPSQIYGLTSLPSWSFPDTRGFLEKHPCMDYLGPCVGPSTTPGWASDRNTTTNIIYIADYPKEKRAPFEIKRGLSYLRRGLSGRWTTRKTRSWRVQKNAFLVSSRTVRGAQPDRPQLLYLTYDDALNALVAIDIAVTADRCNFSRWCTYTNRPGQGHGPSVVTKKKATARKWLVAINTTPTTSIQWIQASHSLSFNTRAFTSTKDTIKLPNLSKFHNCD
jgi:hypothetical protein